MNKNARIYIAGHQGLVGAAIQRQLASDLLLRTHRELDLTQQTAVMDFFQTEQPEYVFLAAAKVGGIHANNTYPADFLRDNLQIQTNIIDAAYRTGVKKLLFLGSSCIYPKLAPQPMKEEYLLTGTLEPSNQWYAIAKIAGIKMCQAYRKQYGFNAISLMPTNLYGPGDNFNLENSHVLPALIRKFHEAKVRGEPSVVVWGTGKPRREFLHVDDLANAAEFLMTHYDSEEMINVGVGEDVTILELAEKVKEVVEYQGTITFDSSKPDGTPQKLLDVSRLKTLGWQAKISLQAGIESTYRWFLENQEMMRDK
ncbi:NAD-dependent epimerase/dehydratase [Candidatus Thiomargarita nelsonii]|uniref:GDP-L-fucose synthase n=1 Tax=Candidatus Thiomargarita nelsonii TaxID=1003181 RepID=A0A0A6NYX6_9GAMM|nr:NAD-dependent epimerase/dehydratase [Candidatus Thiomargarita nelsonii]